MIAQRLGFTGGQSPQRETSTLGLVVGRSLRAAVHVPTLVLELEHAADTRAIGRLS
jgi:hypothetical protein